MKRALFVPPSRLWSGDAVYWTAIVNGERVRAPATAAEYRRLNDAVIAGRKARAKAQRAAHKAVQS
jgi:hypothetical protein